MLRRADASTATPIQPLAPLSAARADRLWSASAWLLLRQERGGPSLAPAGTLGGSQAGAPLLYPLGEGLSLSARAYLPLRRPAGAEAAAGLDWRPVTAIPVHVLAERRQALGREGRSDFCHHRLWRRQPGLPGGSAARCLCPGRHRRPPVARRLHRWIGARRARAVGPIEVGVGAWGAAQPGAARLDAGPGLSYRLPARRANVRIEADWRFRVAGEAAPGSGPALTLAADF